MSFVARELLKIDMYSISIKTIIALKTMFPMDLCHSFNGSTPTISWSISKTIHA